MALLKTLNCSQNTQSQASMHFLTTGILPLLPFGMRWNMCANFKSRKRATVFFKLHLEVVSNAIARSQTKLCFRLLTMLPSRAYPTQAVDNVNSTTWVLLTFYRSTMFEST